MTLPQALLATATHLVLAYGIARLLKSRAANHQHIAGGEKNNEHGHGERR